MTLLQPAARLLMCQPEHFGVLYTINPWMDPASWARQEQTRGASSKRQWDALYATLRGLGAAIELVPPVAGLPDLVFTANAAVVLDRRVLLARFRHTERQGEEAHYEAAFRALKGRGLVDQVTRLPQGRLRRIRSSQACRACHLPPYDARLRKIGSPCLLA